MESNHLLVRNNKDSFTFSRYPRSTTTTTTTNTRRRKPPYVTNHHRSAILRDITDVANVQLEQAVRDLQCFEGLNEWDNHGNATQHNAHRTFALEYIENLLERWSRQVKHTGNEVSIHNSDSNISGASIHTTELQPRTFASVVSSGSKDRNNKFSTNPTTILPASSSISSSNGVTAGNAAPNAWNQPSSLTPHSDDNDAIAALIPFGSYRLGVHSTASDMDLLTLAPPYITRIDFFTSLVTILQNDGRCINVHPIPTAYTPVIKFVLLCSTDHTSDTSGTFPLHIDLVFARVTDASKLIDYHKRKLAQKRNGTGIACKKHLSVKYNLDDTDLQDQDEIGVRSLNGARVSQMILESVQNDVSKFQIVLCAVKHWAQVRGIYSNVLGFLGGVNWAILVAWVCKRYPEASASKTLNLFFHIFSKWQWNNPVMLGETIADKPPICNVSCQTRAITLPSWNPAINPRDKLHLMPIITPAYPSMNSSYNVDFPQLRCIQHELMRTSNMLSRASSNNRNGSIALSNGNSLYNMLFKPSDFFQQHNHYLQISISSTTEEEFVKWFRFVESKIRNLISSLETTEVHAWPFARFFDDPNMKLDVQKQGQPKKYEKYFFIGLRFAPGIVSNNIRHLAMDFLYKVNNWNGRNVATMDLDLAYISANEVPSFVIEAMKEKPPANNTNSGICCTISSSSSYKGGSVDSENTAPTTDDEDDDDIEEVICNVPSY